MKKSLYASAAVLALILASPALAQSSDQDDQNRPRPGRNEPTERPERPTPSTPTSPNGTMGGERETRPPSEMPSTTGGTRHRERAPNTMTAPSNTMRAPSNTMMPPSRRTRTNTRSNTGGMNATTPGGGAAARSGAHVHNPKFDSMRRTFTAPKRFQAGAYVRPSGWYAHRWTSGEFLPAFFFVQTYWILDWGVFALEAPPPGTVWVRVGDDAVLIDQFTGEVIIVEYGLFF